MSCGCANRMRNHVLPALGYTKEGGAWTTSRTDFPNGLRSISDEDIEERHVPLMLRLAGAIGVAQFGALWQAAVVRAAET